MILNSKSEFNRCYIPRLVVEKDEEAKKKRLEQEKKDREEMIKVMEDMDLTWGQKKEKGAGVTSKEEGKCKDALIR